LTKKTVENRRNQPQAEEVEEMTALIIKEKAEGKKY
jgi:hypothetical protein